MRVLLYATILKETENEETRYFCQIFVIGGISVEGARSPWATPLDTPMILRKDRALKFFHKQKPFKATLKKTFFSIRGGLESIHMTVFLKPLGIA